MINKVINFFKKNIELAKFRKRALAYNDEKELAKDVFKSSSIHYSSIDEVYVITIFDADEKLFYKIKDEIRLQTYKHSLDSEFTNNKDHIHFLLFVVDRIRHIVLAILYPYDPLFLPKALWVEEIKFSKLQLEQLMNHKKN